MKDTKIEEMANWHFFTCFSFHALPRPCLERNCETSPSNLLKHSVCMNPDWSQWGLLQTTFSTLLQSTISGFKQATFSAMKILKPWSCYCRWLLPLGTQHSEEDEVEIFFSPPLNPRLSFFLFSVFDGAISGTVSLSLSQINKSTFY